MQSLKLWFFVFILFLMDKETRSMKSKDLNRQKRCIVVQKQSGTHGDSSEGDGGDEDFRKPTNKEPQGKWGERAEDVEVLPPPPLPLKYKILPTKWLRSNLRWITNKP